MLKRKRPPENVAATNPNQKSQRIRHTVWQGYDYLHHPRELIRHAKIAGVTAP
jgi:hypothetical protein